jgi:hypothetical protein
MCHFRNEDWVRNIISASKNEHTILPEVPERIAHFISEQERLLFPRYLKVAFSTSYKNFKAAYVTFLAEKLDQMRVYSL